MSFDRSELIDLVARGRRAKRRAKAAERLLVAAITDVLAAFWGGWMLMFGLAVLSEHWWAAMPTIGYWWSVLAVYLLRGCFSRIPPKADPS